MEQAHPGQVIRHANVESRHVQPRHVDVWCPPGYAQSPEQRYPVIYMHDGQNLFQPAATTGYDWGIVEAMQRVMRDKQLPGAIVVGVWNTALRRQEYMPEPNDAALRDQFAQAAGGALHSDAYLTFLAEELKPTIDAHYRTLPDRPHTFIMGSSMGGLISLYGLCEYPEVFGGAGCLSTHWPIGGDALVEYLGGALPRAGHHKLYFDYGTVGLDANYEPFQQHMDTFLRAAGYQQSRDWRTLAFDGAGHSEQAWRERVHLPLAFLLKGEL